MNIILKEGMILQRSSKIINNPPIFFGPQYLIYKIDINYNMSYSVNLDTMECSMFSSLTWIELFNFWKVVKILDSSKINFYISLL